MPGGPVPGIAGSLLATAYALEAAARDRIGDKAATEGALERALDLAEPDGALVLFLLSPVLRYLPTNLTAPEIARELSVSPNTVRTHIKNLYAKLGTHQRAGAVERARALGLLAPPSGSGFNQSPPRRPEAPGPDQGISQAAARSLTGRRRRSGR